MNGNFRKLGWRKAVTGALAAFALLTVPVAFAETVPVRIKDLAKVQGVRSNQLVGYGLVVGLNGTGDSTKSTETLQSVVNIMKNFGITISQNSLKPKNVAAVIVTATLPPFVREGDTIDITVSSMGDAKSIQGEPLFKLPFRQGTALSTRWPRGQFPPAALLPVTATAGPKRISPQWGLLPMGLLLSGQWRTIWEI